MKKEALADFNKVIVLDKENVDAYYYKAFLFTDILIEYKIEDALNAFMTYAKADDPRMETVKRKLKEFKK